jgi:hypothetical protein
VILQFELSLILLTLNGVPSIIQRGGFGLGLLLSVGALYAAIYLQPLMNEKNKVPHCSGSLDFMRG